MINEREIILDALMEILEKKQYSHLVLKGVLDKYDFLPKQVRSFIKRTCEGTIEQVIRIDYVIDSFSKTKVVKMKPMIRTLLRMGTYQLLYMDGVPDSAVCNESVKLAAKRGFASLKGFVNGVLRNIARNKDKINYPAKNHDINAYLSVTYSMPIWIVDMWINLYGAELTERMLSALLEKRPLTIRFNENLSENRIQEILDLMKQAEISFKQSDELSYAYFLENIDNVVKLPGYENGDFVVQDIGSMQVVEMAGIKEGDYVLDVCAAPGGKAMHAAVKLNGTGHVQARDLTQEKVNRIEENRIRCNLENMDVRVYDATHYEKESIEVADVLIADLPCSGLGVIGRKSDIKYRISMDAIDEIAALQKKILSTIYTYVKKGGILMFSTCTISKKENEQNRDWFLENYPFELIEEKTMMPGLHNSDGFYMAKFKRKENE